MNPMKVSGPYGCVRLLALVAVACLCWAPCRALADAPRVELVTIGPGSEDASRYGHSAMCITAEGAADGRCYDFGVPEAEGGATGLLWDMIRGRPRFVPLAVERSRLVAAFEEQERTIDVQELALTAEQVDRLRDGLEVAVARRRAYAYHPYNDNCTTRLRDALDDALGGQLRGERAGVAPGPKYRELSEQGVTGRLAELTAMAIFVGAPADARPNDWQRMFLPVALRDAVARLGAKSKRIYERREIVLPTSPALGRIALAVLGAAVAALVVWAGRRGRRAFRVALGTVGLVFGGLALLVDVVVVVTAWPELSHNWCALVLLPTDAALGWLPRHMIVRYLATRLTLLAALATLSVSGVIAQPLTAVCVLVALPLAVGLLRLNRTVVEYGG